MALLFWEGFDNFTDGYQLRAARSNMSMNWDYSTARTDGRDPSGNYTSNFYSSGGRFGGSRIVYQYPSDDYWGMISVTNSAELYTGRAIYITQGYDTGIMCVWGNSYSYTSPGSANVVPEVWLDVASGTLRVYRRGTASWNNSIVSSRSGPGGGVLIGSYSNFRYNAWNWIEVRYKMSSTNVTPDGVVQVWLNNQLVIDSSSCITKSSNTITSYIGTNYHCSLGGYNTTGGNWSIDDIYVTDTTGFAPWNTRLGDLRIITVVPTGDTTPNTGTPSTGTTHWGVVDEKPYNTTDYLTIPVDSNQNQEIFVKANTVPVNAAIIALAVNYVANKSDAGVANIRSVIVDNSSGYVANSVNNSLLTSYVYFQDSYTTNPVTSSQWTYANVANILIGVVTST